jgi:DNA-binding transcriptional LysR family regulator
MQDRLRERLFAIILTGYEAELHSRAARRREAFAAQHRCFRRAAAEPLIASFCQAHPEVEVEIAAGEEPTSRPKDLMPACDRVHRRRRDAARLTKPFCFIIVGSPAYLAGSGRAERRTACPESPQLWKRKGEGTAARGRTEAADGLHGSGIQR